MSYRADIVCSDPGHPIRPLLAQWCSDIAGQADASLHGDLSTLEGGDFLFLVSCKQIVKKDLRDRYRWTLVLHAADLPNGKGMSPHVWQILEGKDEIVLTMLNAEDGIDSGDIWQQVPIRFDGTELFDEINDKLFAAELHLMTWAIQNCATATPRKQAGEGSVYPRRRPDDSCVDPNASLAEIFDLLRVADSTRYPAFFEHRGERYDIQIRKRSD